jgi:hypothetical protein
MAKGKPQVSIADKAALVMKKVKSNEVRKKVLDKVGV